MARSLAIALVMIALTTTATQPQGRPSLVPPGWDEVQLEPEKKGRLFVSPNGRARLAASGSTATRNLARDMQEIANKPGEVITYQRRGRSWIAVSGYAGDEIFYRKSNLACGGRHWHHVEFRYPVYDKQQMDKTVTAVARHMTRYNNDCRTGH